MAALGRMMARRTAALVVACALVLGVAVVAIANQEDGPDVRFAFVARGDNPIDALAAAPIAGRLDAPVLLTRPDVLSAEAAQGLVAYGPDVVVVAGGAGAVSAETFAQIQATVPAAEVRRVEGIDRYATAQALAALITEYLPAFVYARDVEDAVVERTQVCSPNDLVNDDFTLSTAGADRVYLTPMASPAVAHCRLVVPTGATITSIEVRGRSFGGGPVTCDLSTDEIAPEPDTALDVPSAPSTTQTTTSLAASTSTGEWADVLDAGVPVVVSPTAAHAVVCRIPANQALYAIVATYEGG